ncbi:transporter substrate-binding domain-containing protein [Pseudomonas sp. PDM16]|uniref:substrate-binding periplasmic protein n=1 Tax=Pseudomonas sp. PDM16 TaxID=2769292 RepID=UPI0017875861|nr:transporter substrate-binding domain-containing protein [Pseudomonas sp. PDM16]MBD9413092.1 transporter substrate-binding domain-containing protein [Pseudomonas sp. PDM16]
MRGISLLLLSLLAWPLAAAELQLYAWERAPLVQQRSDGGAAGLVPELADELFRRAGIAYHLSFLPLQRALHLVQQQPNSCVLLVERQQEREPLFAWVGPLLVSRLSLYAKADDDVQLSSLEQVRGLRVLSHQGSGAGEYLQSIGVEVIYSNKESLNLSMLQRSRARLWATSSAVVDSLSAKPRPREVLPFLTLMEDIACHPRIDPIELQRLQDELRQMYREGRVQALYRKHGLSLQ